MPAKAAAKGPREGVAMLTDIPNIGKSVASDLARLRITEPAQLAGRDPLKLYGGLCLRDGVHHDPCLLDTFMAAIDYMNGAPARPWWKYTARRKALLAARGVARRGPGKRK